MNDEDDEDDNPRPCNWEKMSGVCMICGCGPYDLPPGIDCEHWIERTTNGGRHGKATS